MKPSSTVDSHTEFPVRLFLVYLSYLLITIQITHEKVLFCAARKLKTHRAPPGDQNLRGGAEEAGAES